MKYILSFLILCLSFLNVNAETVYQGNLTEDILFKGTPVRITPTKRITTSKKALTVGSTVSFVTSRDVIENDNIVVKRNTPVKGKVLEIVPNRIMGIPAKLTMGKFETTDVFGQIIPLTGTIKKEGNPHNTLISYMDILAVFVRGGEVQVVPEEDYFILFY